MQLRMYTHSALRYGCACAYIYTVRIQRVKCKCRRAVRNIDGDLKQKLLAVREVYKERASFSMIGIRFLCPDSTINDLCKEAKYIESAEDAILLRVRPELRDKVLMS